ncbi:hypothetical protein NAI46_11790, partial [Francisella tularensis subsp. holarctica]|nr:hypothetical protein [Francisella tularensis subsp. holarctica]
DIKDQPQPNLQASNQDLEQPIIDETKPDVSRTEIKLQEKLQQIREIQLQHQQNAANQDKGLFKKIIGNFKKIS